MQWYILLENWKIQFNCDCDCVNKATRSFLRETLEDVDLVSREIRVCRLLRHPDIIRYSAAFIRDDAVWAVTELMTHSKWERNAYLNVVFCWPPTVSWGGGDFGGYTLCYYKLQVVSVEDLSVSSVLLLR